MPRGTLTRTSTARLVTRILDQPELVHVIRGLDAPVLRRLIDHVGLEDMGEVVSLATPEQIARIFDEDLWRSRRPGEDEAFDAGRFGLWLDVLLEAGEATAIEKLADMDEDLLALGLARLCHVIDIDALAAEMSERHDDDDLLEKALESSLYEEIAEFRVIARDPTRWDALITLLTALDRDHHALVRRLLERVAAATDEYVEDNGGLYDVLTSDEMLESDVAFDREQRREREGFVGPSAAASFLRHARVTPLAELVGAKGPDPVTKAHFRAAPRPTAPIAASPKVQEFLRELGAAGVLEAASPRRGVALERRAGDDPSWLERGMRALRAADPRVFATRVEELAYLVNLLVAVSGSGEDALRPTEAAEVTTRVCTLGLVTTMRELGTEHLHDGAVTALLRDHDLVKAFRVGWHLVGDEAWTAGGLRATAERARSRAGSR